MTPTTADPRASTGTVPPHPAQHQHSAQSVINQTGHCPRVHASLPWLQVQGVVHSAPALQRDASIAVDPRAFRNARGECRRPARRGHGGVSVRGAAHGLGGGLGAPIPVIGARAGPASGRFRSLPKGTSATASIHTYITTYLLCGRKRKAEFRGIPFRNGIPAWPTGIPRNCYSLSGLLSLI